MTTDLVMGMAWWGWALIGGVVWLVFVCIAVILGAAAGDEDDEMGVPRG